MRAVGVRGAAWSAGVSAWGDLFVEDQERLRWFIAADDRWYRPSRETTVRQREVSGVPVIETRIKVPGGDAVQRVYGVANFGGAIVVEIYNDSSLPFAVAFDRGDISTMREPSPTGVQGIDLPAGSVVFPVGHHATMRAAILVGAGFDAANRRLTAQEIESLPSFEQVERGWLGALQISSRVDVPNLSWSSVLTSQRCKVLLSNSAELAESSDISLVVDLLLDRAERVRLGDKPAQWVDEVAVATERILKQCAKTQSVQWFEERALLGAGMVLNRAGESRGLQDFVSVWSRLAEAGRISDLALASPEIAGTVRQIAWIESQLVAQRRDGVIEICPCGIDKSWLGVNFECHKLLASPEHLISYAVRWHGEKPALLWEIDGPVGTKVAASAIDRTFSSTEMRGETLLSGFTS
ncbi:MAG: hypothetical protein JHD11_03825 [Ilumatobacteraceae bacterium]|jgi:hypothetical protein|nr:hypothetical protein [Ilumatobacteraceae bacterium]